MISTILVGTDGSEAAAAAERYGVALASRLNVRVQGLSVVEDRWTRGLREDGLGVAPPPLDALATYLESRAEAACRRLAEAANGASVENSCETVNGIADDRLVERCRRRSHMREMLRQGMSCASDTLRCRRPDFGEHPLSIALAWRFVLDFGLPEALFPTAQYPTPSPCEPQ